MLNKKRWGKASRIIIEDYQSAIGITPDRSVWKELLEKEKEVRFTVFSSPPSFDTVVAKFFPMKVTRNVSGFNAPHSKEYYRKKAHDSTVYSYLSFLIYFLL